MTETAHAVCTPAQMAGLIDAGMIRPGMWVSHVRAGRSPIGWAIERIQRRVLADLRTDLDPAEIEAACAYTHTSMVYDANGIVECSAPRCRVRSWDQLSGCRLLFSDPAHATPLDRDGACMAAFRDVAAKRKYSRSDLLFFYFRWHRKTKVHAKFATLFRSAKYDYCTGTVLRWWRSHSSAAPFPGEQTEAVYPARVAVSGEFRHVLVVDIL